VGTDTNAEQRKAEARLGCAHAHRLFALVTEKIRRREGVEAARSISDYLMPELEELRAGLPPGVEVHRLADLV
jgi:hypothetical protein